jgi:hypothetical protein
MFFVFLPFGRRFQTRASETQDYANATLKATNRNELQSIHQ